MSGPGLTRMVHDVRALELGERTGYAAGRLSVSEERVRELLRDPALARIRLACAAPGDSARIVGALDAVQPCSKGPGGGGVFPGLLAPALPVGRGETHVLRGAAVVAAGYLPRAQEAVVDMTGPAQPLSPLGTTCNLVVEFEPAEGASWEDVDTALRRGLASVAAHLAEAALDVEPDAVEHVPEPGAGNGKPRVGVVTNLQTQGKFKDVFVYGRSLSGGLPTVIAPGELDDGAVVSGQYGHPALKNPTYLHQTHPVVAALLDRGDELELAALVLCPEPVDQASKELVSAHAARLCASLRLDAAIVTKEGGGNADADVSLKLDRLEEEGIAAVGILAEMAGRDGTGPPLVVPPAKATAMVSTGNYDERMTLPAVDRALGKDRVALLDRPATDELELPVAAIYCALSTLGQGTLTCTEIA